MLIQAGGQMQILWFTKNISTEGAYKAFHKRILVIFHLFLHLLIYKLVFLCF